MKPTADHIVEREHDKRIEHRVAPRCQFVERGSPFEVMAVPFVCRENFRQKCTLLSQGNGE